MQFGSLLIPLGLVPSLLALYIFVGRYEGKFNERKTILSYVLGFIFGLIIYLIEMFNLHIGTKIYVFDVLIASFAFSFIEQTAKVMILNAKFLKEDALPIYGASLGSGFSSTFAPIFIQKINLSIEGLIVASIPIFVIFSTIYSSLLVAIGIKKKKLIYIFSSILYSFLIWLILIFSFNFKYTSYFFILILLLAIVSIASIYHAYYKLLPYSMLKRRELRKIL